MDDANGHDVPHPLSMTLNDLIGLGVKATDVTLRKTTRERVESLHSSAGTLSSSSGTSTNTPSSSSQSPSSSDSERAWSKLREGLGPVSYQTRLKAESRLAAVRLATKAREISTVDDLASEEDVAVEEEKSEDETRVFSIPFVRFLSSRKAHEIERELRLMFVEASSFGSIQRL